MTSHQAGLTWFVGWDKRGGAARGHQAADASHTLSQPEEEGAVETYQLLAVAARGFRPPEFLTISHTGEEDQPADQALGPDGSELRQAWSLGYRHIAETNPRECSPYGLYLLGVNPPEAATDDDLEVFNDFYTNVHLREVVERRHASRAVRYELVRTVKAPFKGAPRFLAVYEVDEQSASQRRHVGPPYSRGPEVWQGHTTPWRLWFRNSGSWDNPAS
jgi:hypothetical protein